MRTVHSANNLIHLVTFSILLLSYLASHLTLAAENSVRTSAQPSKLQNGSLTTVQPSEQQTGSPIPYNYPQYPYPFSQYPGSYPYQYPYQYPYPLYPYSQYPYYQYPYYQYPIPPPVRYGYPHVGNNESPLSGSTGLAGNVNAGSGIPNGGNINPNTGGGFPIGGSNVPQNGGVGLPQNIPFMYPYYYGNLGYRYPQFRYPYGKK